MRRSDIPEIRDVEEQCIRDIALLLKVNPGILYSGDEIGKELDISCVDHLLGFGLDSYPKYLRIYKEEILVKHNYGCGSVKYYYYKPSLCARAYSALMLRLGGRNRSDVKSIKKEG
jgi:hypothetical protein